MTFTLSNLNGWLILGVAFLLSAAGLFFWQRWHLRRPVVCVCLVNGCVGVVLRKDYNKASRRHWRLVQDGTVVYEQYALGRVVEVRPTFFFTWETEGPNQKLRRLLDSCYVERAALWVPSLFPGQVVKFPVDNLEDAWLHIHGSMLPRSTSQS